MAAGMGGGASRGKAPAWYLATKTAHSAKASAVNRWESGESAVGEGAGASVEAVEGGRSAISWRAKL